MSLIITKGYGGDNGFASLTITQGYGAPLIARITEILRCYSEIIQNLYFCSVPFLSTNVESVIKKLWLCASQFCMGKNCDSDILKTFDKKSFVDKSFQTDSLIDDDVESTSKPCKTDSDESAVNKSDEHISKPKKSKSRDSEIEKTENIDSAFQREEL